MCGICFVCALSRPPNVGNVSVQDILRQPDLQDEEGSGDRSSKFGDMIDGLLSDTLLHRRGPDASSRHTVTLNEDVTGYMQGCVLHLRGQLTPQPVTDQLGNALLWNGEIFGGGLQVTEDDNDTDILFHELIKCSTDEDILTTMQKVHGPWAFIFWQADSGKLWFGRDKFGRRSFLWHLPGSDNDNDDLLVLSSVSLGDVNFAEVPAVGIFSLDFHGKPDQHRRPSLTLYPWAWCRWPGTTQTVTGTDQTNILKYLYPHHSSHNSLHISVHIDNRMLLTSWIPQINHNTPDCDPSASACDVDTSGPDLHQMLRLDTSGPDLHQMLRHILETRDDLDVLAQKLIHSLQQAVEKRVHCLPRHSNIEQDYLPRHSNIERDCLPRHSNIEQDWLRSTGRCQEANGHESLRPSFVEEVSEMKVIEDVGQIKVIEDVGQMKVIKDVGQMKVIEDVGQMKVIEDVGQMKADEGRDLLPQAKVAVLFSGGLDSTILATLADRCVPAGEPIDLLNVAFQQSDRDTRTSQRKNKHSGRAKAQHSGTHQAQHSGTHQAQHSGTHQAQHSGTHQAQHSGGAKAQHSGTHQAQHSGRHQAQEVSWRSRETPDYSSMEHGSCDCGSVSESGDGSHKPSSSTTSTQDKYTLNPGLCTDDDALYPHLAVGATTGCLQCTQNNEMSDVLDRQNNEMSDVLDRQNNEMSDVPDRQNNEMSDVLDRQNNEMSDVLDTQNNEMSDVLDRQNDEISGVNKPDLYNVPDRQTARTALSELNPGRCWNFVEINVSQSELESVRKHHIRKLIYPSQTVLDDSIGCAVWFAARGSGVKSHEGNKRYVSRAKVLLCGMAADEQFAGYSRHRVTFKTKGWAGLVRDIEEEMWRISARNLGRDDRIITDHGKEARFPFLDETFTQLVSSIPIHNRADLRLPRGAGEKLLLRLCALKLGLDKTSVQPKRAIQFGSKIAKLDNRKEKGSDVCDRLS